MADRVIIEEGKVDILTDEGRSLKLSEADLEAMLTAEARPPLNGESLADGVKFVECRHSVMVVVHQTPPLVRRVRWIAEDSPVPYGEGTSYRTVRLSMPYAITFATFYRRGGRLSLITDNELYFRNEPLRHKRDRVGYPALLNVSKIETGGRLKAWICTEHLRAQRTAESYSAQLDALLEHTWNGAFNLSSEHHEGSSWYGESKGIHPDLHPVERWHRATAAHETFALSVPWIEANHSAGELIECILTEQLSGLSSGMTRLRRAPKRISLVGRILNYAQSAKGKSV